MSAVAVADGRTAAQIADACGGRLVGAPPPVLRGVAPLDEAGPQEVSFYSNPAYRARLAATQAGLVIVSEADAALPELSGRALLVARTPYAAFARVSAVFHPPAAFAPGVDALARVAPGAEVHPEATVEAFAFVGAGARIGARAVLRSGASVGAGAQVGAGSVLHPGARVADGCIVGERCILHMNCVVGADGFGFAFDPQGDGDGPQHRKIPQAGIARLEDDVELGACSCVDRATLGETVVGRGTKIDNLVQIAHNVRVGPLCVIAAQAGIAGSTTVGAGVAIGGQVGIVGHIRVGDMARIAAQSGIAQEVEPGAELAGSPAMERRRWLRMTLSLARVPELLRDVRRLAARVAELEKALAGR